MATYNEKSIKHLSGLTAIRKKPEMYIGSTDEEGVWTILRELADNCADEFMAERNNLCHMICEKGGTYWALDSGEGIPIGDITVEDSVTHKKHKISALKAIVSLTHTGGKFEKEYKKGSRGTHGVGMKATNALSLEFQVWTYRNGKWFTIRYEKGKLVKDVTKVSGPPTLPHGIKKPKHGTIIRFVPDPEIFGKVKTFEVARPHDWAELGSILNSGLLIKYTNEKGKTTEWVNKKGIDHYIKQQVEKLKAGMLGKIFTYKDPHMDLAVAFTDYDGIALNAYTNGLFNKGGGIHVDTFYDAMTKVLMPMKKKKDKFKPSDLRDGLIGLVNVKIEAPKFGGQTKEKLLDARVKDLCKVPLEKALQKFFSANKSLVKRILERATKFQELKAEFTKNKKVLKALSVSRKSKTILPGKLISSPHCKVSERELYIVEGDSAKGTAEFARDEKFQEVLPLKGKILNVFKDKKGKAFESVELMNILMAIGFDPSSKNPMENLRINELFIMADADVDGDHIGALCKAALARYLPEMFQREMVYMVKTPEYIGEGKGLRFFGASVEELKKAAGDKFKYLNVQHIKGLAEMSAEALHEVAFNPLTRRLLHVEKPTADDMKRFKAVMAEDVQVRKTLLGL